MPLYRRSRAPTRRPGSDLEHVLGLQPFGAFYKFELDILALVKGAIAVPLNGAKVGVLPVQLILYPRRRGR